MTGSPAAEAELPLVVRWVRSVADGIVHLGLAAVDGSTLPAWTPGAHVDLLLLTADGAELVRQYSLCGDPADRSVYEVAVLLEPASRGGSAAVHASLTEGSSVRVRGPRNHFELEPSPAYLFVAGGIGITPILPMVAAAHAAGATWRLVYGGRTSSSMAFVSTVRESYPDRVDVRPQDEHGLLDLETLLGTPAPDTLVYCCGPEPLLAAVESRCAAWPLGSLHLERFAPKEVGEPVRSGSFEVELASSGLVLEVPPELSVLEVVEKAGVQVLSSCTEGTCGTCETGVLAGEVDHRDSLLSPQEQAANDTMFVCVSRSTGARLVLDL